MKTISSLIRHIWKQQDTLKTSFGSDLAWLCQSPQLIDLATAYGHIEPFNLNNDLAREHLKTPALRQQRLGIYYENLLEQYFQHNSKLQLLYRNLQIRQHYKDKQGGNTLGEFDVIYRDKATHETNHLELACKFYLGIETQDSASQDGASPWKNWIGPNCNDRLDIKLLRLINHQLKLSRTEEATAELAKRGIQRVDRTQLLLQGYFFYPINGRLPPPEYATKNHLKGLWCTSNQLSQLPHLLGLHEHELSAVVIPPWQWLATKPLEYYQQHFRFEELLAYTEQQLKQSAGKGIRPIQCSLRKLHSETTEQDFFDIRIMVVDDHWQHRAMSCLSHKGHS